MKSRDGSRMPVGASTMETVWLKAVMGIKVVWAPEMDSATLTQTVRPSSWGRCLLD